ncbi:MAG: hypothetical protein M1467_03935 [Deltaproteobacteria bacterium]|nr:hypothetical protein [Deltaproteobacteria bacterium]
MRKNDKSGLDTRELFRCLGYLETSPAAWLFGERNPNAGVKGLSQF